MTKRIASIERNTKETQIKLSLNLDGEGKADIDTGVGFFNHMLTLLAFHSGMDLEVKATDVVDKAAEAGIKAIIQPGGSIRDQESIDACNEHGIAMVFTGLRHFKH